MRSDELEKVLGGHIRNLRIGQRLTQSELADRANVSVGALKHLESGSGATTYTLVRVLRALGQERWLETLSPGPAPFNPLDLLGPREKARAARPTRVRHRRPPAP
jgi:transcriptional regulator with XRE-family HTH domain